MPVTVVSRSRATVAIAVFITVVSSAITNWPAARVARTTPAASAAWPDFVIDAKSFVRGRPARHLIRMKSTRASAEKRPLGGGLGGEVGDPGFEPGTSSL